MFCLLITLKPIPMKTTKLEKFAVNKFTLILTLRSPPVQVQYLSAEYLYITPVKSYKGVTLSRDFHAHNFTPIGTSNKLRVYSQLLWNIHTNYVQKITPNLNCLGVRQYRVRGVYQSDYIGINFESKSPDLFLCVYQDCSVHLTSGLLKS